MKNCVEIFSSCLTVKNLIIFILQFHILNCVPHMICDFWSKSGYWIIQLLFPFYEYCQKNIDFKSRTLKGSAEIQFCNFLAFHILILVLHN